MSSTENVLPLLDDPSNRHASSSMTLNQRSKSRTVDEPSAVDEIFPYPELPAELKADIFNYLNIKDASSLRQSSASWAVAGTSRLFRDGFKLHPHCQPSDMSRLHQICDSPHLAPTIKKFVIFLDSSDARKWTFYFSDAREILRRRIANEPGYCDPSGGDDAELPARGGYVSDGMDSELELDD
ncbi:hypothetical protein CJF30_00006683 [Rutstroemia sp. NJR-2017a BBW]|nr:hypothetical protein CJF30_00006683 [Rutstroemia sp. NJR-2017a BBW]